MIYSKYSTTSTKSLMKISVIPLWFGFTLWKNGYKKGGTYINKNTYSTLWTVLEIRRKV